MKVKELITEIDKSVDELDLVTTRRYIEDNIDILNESRNLLKGNARELLKFLTSRQESGYETLISAEMATINAINTFANKFDLKSMKVTIKNKEQLLLKNDFVGYLNSDAKIILEGMGAIEKNENIKS